MVAGGHTASFRSGESTPHPELRSRQSAPATTSVVCRQCRARKVKCDRKEPCCSPCTRLRFVCSLGRHSTSLTPERTPPEGLTQAGIKRKRVKRACQPCQLIKAKCSGTYPCKRCHGKGLECDLERRQVARISTSSPTPSNLSSISGPHTGHDLPVTGLSGLKTVPPCEKGEIQDHVYTYFRKASRSGMSLLHRPIILASWLKGTIEPALLKLIASIGLFESSSDAGSDLERTRARRCIQEVQDETLRYMGKQTITQLSILVILLKFRFDVGDFAEAWTLIAIASRLVFTMRLNHEHEGLDAPTQETIRRLVWTVYEIDRKCSGGIDYLTVCPVDKMYIRLPCDENSFEMALRSTLPFLEDGSTRQNNYLGAHSYKLRLLATRDRILRCTKHIRKSGGDLSSTRADLDSLQHELNIFQVGLPSEMEVSTQKLDLMVHSDEGLRCIELHTMWLLGHCDLYRHCIPGIRESASHEALSQTPSNFIDYCQRACFNGAVKLCDLWSELHDLHPSKSLGDGMMAVAIYQVAQILHHLPHLLALDDNIDIASSNHGPKIDEIQGKLLKAIDIVRPKHATRSYPWANCVEDAGKLVAALGRTRRRWEEICPSPLPSDLSDMLDDYNTQHDHLQSRHHMLAYIARDDEQSESSQRKQVSGTGGSADTQTVCSSTSSDALAPRPHEPKILPAANDISNTGIPYVPEDYFLEDRPIWDPFDMAFNDYYDNNIEALFEPAPIRE